MRAQPGCLTTRIGEQYQEAPNIFVVISVWSDLESLRAFFGEHWEEGLILPGEADLMEQATVEHYSETYHSLAQLWRAHTDLVKRREITALQAPLTDTLWNVVRPAIPPGHLRGRPQADDRSTLNGILYVLRNGCRWRDLPAGYGHPVTCWRRFTRWQKDGTWERIWYALLAAMSPSERCAWALAFIDSSYIPTQSGRPRRVAVPQPALPERAS